MFLCLKSIGVSSYLELQQEIFLDWQEPAVKQQGGFHLVSILWQTFSNFAYKQINLETHPPRHLREAQLTIAIEIKHPQLHRQKISTEFSRETTAKRRSSNIFTYAHTHTNYMLKHMHSRKCAWQQFAPQESDVSAVQVSCRVSPASDAVQHINIQHMDMMALLLSVDVDFFFKMTLGHLQKQSEGNSFYASRHSRSSVCTL